MEALGGIARAIDRLSEKVGNTVAWLALFMVLVEFLIVMLRYVFGVGWIALQESVVYMHATVFMVAAGYTLLHNGHVRCDIFYNEAPARRKAMVDLFGVIVFLLPMCVLVWVTSWSYVISSWRNFEGSPEGTLGLPIVYLLKSVILVFDVLLSLQAVSLAIHSLLVLLGVERDGPVGPEEVEGM